jgi:DNA-directed RNA polymerase subunit K/omega
MNKNIKLLDRFDKKENIYELVYQLAERVHQILNGAAVSSTTKEKDPVQIVMEEFLDRRKRMNDLLALLQRMKEINASDLHIKFGQKTYSSNQERP